ncbi:MFS transporter [Dyadobacter sp. OTU695]|uniref:MFS transporter n=1 Tax=Dyadobacter sp. OTU695 TaxID=3043860 RepID=UPI00313DB9AD
MAHAAGTFSGLDITGPVRINKGYGPVTCVTLSEIFPNRIRGNAMAVATLALWIANFFTTALFPVMNQYFGVPVTFLIHAAICLVYFFFIRTSIPETKGRTLEEIEKILQKR